MPTAFITGATAGIGPPSPRRLPAEGRALVLLARDATRLEKAARDPRGRYGSTAETLPADLATDDGIAAAERRLADGVDLLINNAGFAQKGRFLDVPVEDELVMLRVHCEVVLRLTYAALPGMIERSRGAVVNVASVAAFFSRGTYGASKAWVVGFSQGVEQDIRVRGGRGGGGLARWPRLLHTGVPPRAQKD